MILIHITQAILSLAYCFTWVGNILLSEYVVSSWLIVCPEKCRKAKSCQAQIVQYKRNTT